MRTRTWFSALCAGAALSLAHPVMPSPLGDVTYLAVGILAVVAIGLAIRRQVARRTS